MDVYIFTDAYAPLAVICVLLPFSIVRMCGVEVFSLKSKLDHASAFSTICHKMCDKACACEIFMFVQI